MTTKTLVVTRSSRLEGIHTDARRGAYCNITLESYSYYIGKGHGLTYAFPEFFLLAEESLYYFYGVSCNKSSRLSTPIRKQGVKALNILDTDLNLFHFLGDLF